MKRIITILLMLNLGFILISQENSFFKYKYQGNPLDYQTGNSLFPPTFCMNIEKTDDITYCKIVIDDYEEAVYEMFYVDGILKKEIADVHETSINNYTYSEKGFLLECGEKVKYKYISENCREEYYKDKPLAKETIAKTENGFKHTSERIDIYDDNKMKLYKISEYCYENGKIVSIVINVYMSGKFYTTWYLDFTYEDGLLSKVVYHYGLDDIRNIYTFKYNELGQCIEMNDENVRRPEECCITKYYDYDSHGNWHKSEYWRKNVLYESVKREIKYKES